MTHSIDADPAGDLVLKLGSGDEVTLIRVQSKVLGLASPVFAAMLSPRFAEGQALEDGKGMVDSTTAIELPDDDPTAMSLLCSTLHFKENAAQRKSYSPEFLIGLAVICDKYRVSRALSPWSNIWMEKFQLEGQDDHFDTAGISYGLEHHESFWKSTRDILRHSTLPELDIEHSLLPDNVIDILRIHRKELLDQLQSNAESLVITLLECDCHFEELQSYGRPCQHLDTLGTYQKCLFRRRLWPISTIQTYSISEVSKAFESFPNLEYRSSDHHSHEYLSPRQRMSGGTSYSTSQEVDLKSRLDKAVGDVNRKVTGLCLSCVKHGRYTEKDGNCHAELECHFLAETEHETA